MGNWTTDKKTEYYNVRITGDAKHFAESGEKGTDNHRPAATFLSIVDGTKNGEDIFIDVKVEGKRAETLATLKKGAEVTVIGPVHFVIDKSGKLRGKIYNAEVKLSGATREALKTAAAEAAADPVADTEAPAFE